MESIRAKIAGKKIKVAPKREVEKVVSLMDALKKSLQKKKKGCLDNTLLWLLINSDAFKNRNS